MPKSDWYADYYLGLRFARSALYILEDRQWQDRRFTRLYRNTGLERKMRHRATWISWLHGIVHHRDGLESKTDLAAAGGFIVATLEHGYVDERALYRFLTECLNYPGVKVRRPRKEA